MDSVSRTTKVKENIKWIFILKILSVAISYALIPITYRYLTNEVYGVWITIFSILSWFNYFDIGLGNGLRNRLAETLANNQRIEARKYISTSYFSLSFVSIILFFLISIISFLLNWNIILNTDILPNKKLIFIVISSTLFISISFIMNIINSISYASQMAALTGVSGILTNIIMLVLINILISLKIYGLEYFVITFGVSTIVSICVLNAYYFIKNPDLIPHFKYYDKTKLKDILYIGFKFFIIQIAVLVIFTSSNILIVQLFGPSYVSSYNIVQRLFGIIVVINSLIMAPYWSAFTDAYVKSDIGWIIRVIKFLNKLMILNLILTLLLALLSKWIIKVWIGPDLVFSNQLIFAITIYTIVIIWNNIYSYFLNGINEIDGQVITALIGCLVNIPLAIFFVKFLNMDNSGVVLASVCSLIIFSIYGPIKTFTILKVASNRSGANVL